MKNKQHHGYQEAQAEEIRETRVCLCGASEFEQAMQAEKAWQPQYNFIQTPSKVEEIQRYYG